MSNIELVPKQATEAIRDKYHLKGIDLLSIVSVILSERSSSSQFAAFDVEGVTIYDYTQEGELIEYGSLRWEEFHSIVIKHFELKTNFTFIADDRFRKLSIIDGNGEEVEEFIREHTTVAVERVEPKWYNKVPGFRSETRWKMITGAIIYLWILGAIYNIMTNL